MNLEKIAEKVKNILLKYGNKCQLRRVEKSVYNEETEEYEDEEILIDGSAVMDFFNFQNIDGKNIFIGDLKFMCSFEDIPKIDDTLIFADREYKVISVTPLNPNGLCNVYYVIQARA